MIDIKNHPIWQGHPMWGTITPFKKRAHLMRFFLAKQYARFFPRSMFIGITGSVGKTTTIACCERVLSQKFNTLTTVTNLDPVFNIPITILKIKPKKTEKVLLEMGIEYPGEMEFYLNMVKPAIGIITRLSLAHSEFLGGVEEIAQEKGRLIQQLPANGYAILNWDDITVRNLAQKTKAQVFFYGSDKENCHLWIDNKKITDMQTVYELNYGVERVEIKSRLIGFHQIYPQIAAAALGVTQGINLISIKKALEAIEPVEHRLSPLVGIKDSIILDDTHNSSPVALEEALETLNNLPARKRIVVLGEMRELGEFSEKMHRQIAGKIFKDKVDLVFTGQGDANFIADELIKLGFPANKIESDMQNAQIISKLSKILSKGDVVLVKASRTLKYHEIVNKLSKGLKS